MVFSGLTFLMFFLPVFLAVYYLIPTIKAKNVVIFIFSLLFYSWGEPVYVLIMIFSTVLDYFCGKFAEKYRGKMGAKAALIISVLVNIGMLCVFKYSDFLIGNFRAC